MRSSDEETRALRRRCRTHYLDGSVTGLRGTCRKRERLVKINGIDDPEPAEVLLRLDVWAVGCDGRQLGVLRLNRGEQSPVFATMVLRQCDAKSTAVEQQICCDRGRRVIRFEGFLNKAKCFAQAVVHFSQFIAPGEKPGRVALSHANTKEAMLSSCSCWFGASMPDTVCHRHATLHPFWNFCAADAGVFSRTGVGFQRNTSRLPDRSRAPGRHGYAGRISTKEHPMSFQAYLDAIENKTGKTPRQLVDEAKSRGYDSNDVKAGEILQWLKDDYDLGRGHGMALVHVIKKGPTIDSKHVGSGGTHNDDSDTLWLDGQATKP